MALYAFLQGDTVAHLSPVRPVMTSYKVVEVDEESPPLVGQVYDAATGTFADPVVEPPPEPEPKFRTSISRAEYYGLFTPTEEAMIRLTAGENITLEAIGAATGAEKTRLIRVASLAVMLKRTDALDSTARFSLTNPQVAAGLDLLVALGLITGARKTEILKGIQE